MNRHVTKMRLLATLFIYTNFKTGRILLIFLSMMRHGLLPFVMSFKIIKLEVLKISRIFFSLCLEGLFIS